MVRIYIYISPLLQHSNFDFDSVFKTTNDLEIIDLGKYFNGEHANFFFWPEENMPIK